MAQQQFNVNLTFTANTQQAKAQMRDLQKTFNNLSANLNQQISLKGLTTELRQGYEAAKNLQSAIQSATNMDTGKLDLTKFNRSLTNSGKSLKTYAEDLSALGPEGKMAFSQMASAISSAEVPLRKTNMLVDKLWNSLKNVATWQISSSLLQGFTGAISDAYKYAHDLNGSLNDIRIVTGQNIDQMAKFAKQANETAKVLSTTTKEYAKASLIYFQQGLTDAEVQKRTDITIKMANVTGTSAQQVSDQMTAVWNNFYDGSKSLEYYADVMTALGAATASSTDEISEGLNKFAAVAETVGLSYEYAASALATLTSETRESAEVVGNALKTLFARIQGLQLGETLEDGVTLNKYSEALAKVGINVLDTNGNLKEMDAILNEMGAKWDTLGKAEQVALAQTVAGVRQYNQLISLMDNWDKFQTNLNMATGSSGALQKQADIYAESWEAAEKRVKASAEAIYQKLLNDEFFIDLTNLFADLLDMIKGVIDSLGGLPGLLGLMGTAVTKFAGDKILSSLNSVMDQFSASSKRARQEALETKQTAAKLASDIALGDASQEMAVRSDMIARENKLKLEIFNIDRDLTEFEQEKLAQITEQAKVLDDLLLFQAQIADEKQREVEAAQKAKELAQQELDIVKKTSQEIGGRFDAQTIIIAQKASTNAPGLTEQTAQDTLSSFEKRLAKAYGKQGNLSNEIKNVSVELNKQLTAWGLSSEEIEKYTQNLIETVKIKQEVINKTAQNTKAQKEEKEALKQVSRAQKQVSETSEEQIKIYEKAGAQVLALKNAQSTLGTVFMNTVQGVSSFATGLSSLSSIIDVWNNKSLSGWEKFNKILTSLGFALPMLINGWKSMSQVLNINTAKKIANALATWGQVAAEKALNNEIGASPKDPETTKSSLKSIIKDAKNKWGEITFNNASKDLQNSYLDEALKNNGYKKTAIGHGYNKAGHRGAISEEVAKQSILGDAQAMAGKTAFSSLAQTGVASLAIAAGIAIAAGSAQLLSQYLNKDKIAAEKAAKEAETLKNIYNEISNSYQDLKSTISNYDNQLKSIQDMQQGTLEWKEAITAANDEALELIKTYDTLAGKYSINRKSGLIEFNEGALEDAQEEKYLQMLEAQRVSLSASNIALETQNTADITEFNRTYAKGRSFGDDEDLARMGNGAVIGAGAGLALGGIAALISLISGPVGWATLGTAALASVIGGAAGGLTIGKGMAAFSNDSTAKEEQVINDLAKIYADRGEGIFAEQELHSILETELNIKDEALIKSLMEHKDELQKLIVATDANTKAIELQNRQAMQSFMDSFVANNPEYAALWENTQDKSSIANLMVNSEAYESIVKDRRKEYNKQKDKEVHKAYLEAIGVDLETAQYKNKTGEMEYTDANGAVHRISDETIRQYLAEEAAKEDQARRLNDYVITFDELRADAVAVGRSSSLKKTDAYGMGDAIAAFYGGDASVLASLTSEQHSAMIDAFNAGKLDITDEQAQLAGFDSAKAYKEKLIEILNAWDASIAAKKRDEQELSAYNAALETGVNQLEINKNTLEMYAEALAKTSNAMEENTDISVKSAIAYTKFSKGLTGIKKVIDENRTALVDWDETNIATWEAVSQLQTELTNLFGVNVSADFIKNNLRDIETLLNGNIEVLDDLQTKAAADYILHLDVEDASAKNKLQQFVNAVLVAGADMEKGATIDIGPTLDSLDALLKAGVITGEQVQNVLYAIGYSAEIVGNTINSVTKLLDNNDLSGILDDIVNSLDDMVDRYHYIERLTANLQRNYDRVSKARERAFGVDKLALYEHEIKQLEALRDATAQYAAEAESHYYEDRDALLAGPYGVILDSDGEISNYDELVQFSKDEKFQKLVANYEESLTTWKDKLQEVIDKENELLDKKLENIQYKIDLSIKLDEQSQKYYDFLIGMADDPLYDAADKLKNMGNKMASSKKMAIDMSERITDIFTASGWSESDVSQLLAGENIENLLANNTLTEAQVEILEQYRDQLYATMQVMMTWTDDIRDTVIAAFDELSETFDESSAKLDHYNKILSTYENIIDLVGRDTLGISDSFMGELSQASVDNAMAVLAVNKEAYETNKAALKELRAADQTDWSDEAKEAWDEAVKHAEEKVRESEAVMFESWENALQAAAEAFEKAVETAVSAYEKSMSGIYGSFEAMQTTYDQQTTLNERYLSDYEKIYQLSKLNRQITNSIDETDNVRAKNELAKLQKEILELSESDAEVSEYQIEYLQKQYDLRLAQIALEDAQNAKSQVRMRRDAEGNWSYVYTADQNNIENAQQNYEDKLFALQEFNQQYVKENSDALLQLQQEYSEALNSIKREDFASQEEYEAKLQEITDYYQQMINYRSEQLNMVTTNAKTLYDEDWKKYSEATGYKISENKKWVDNFQETQIAIVGNYKTINDFQDSFNISSTTLIESLRKAYGIWREAVGVAMSAAGTSTKNFANQVNAATSNIQEDTEKIVGSLEKIGDTALSAFEEVVTAASGQYAEYSKYIDDYITKNLKLIASLNEVIRKKAEAAGAVSQNTVSQGIEDLTPNLSGEGIIASPQPNNGYEYLDDTNKKIIPDKEFKEFADKTTPPWQVGDTITFSKGSLTGSPFKSKTESAGWADQTYSNVEGYKFTIVSDYDQYGWVGTTNLPTGSPYFYIWKSDLERVDGFDTGGYTGSWGSNGRLAMLHQKEIVLNADDTAKFLSAVEIVRDISRIIDLRAAAQQTALGRLVNYTMPAPNQILEQQVTIHAEFPNATQRGEIEAAFDTLINRASQFANRKN